jgi:soluble lytic murein transglycosylase-like protein
VDSKLVRAVIEAESAYVPCAVSQAGALGLMQLMPATAEELKVTDPFDAVQNVAAGTQYLKMMLDRYGGDLAKALAAYNAGPARVDAAKGIPPIAETEAYVKKILGRIEPVGKIE